MTFLPLRETGSEERGEFLVEEGETNTVSFVSACLKFRIANPFLVLLVIKGNVHAQQGNFVCTC